MLAAIERGKTLDEARDRLDGLAPNDRAFSNAIVLAALRHYGEIEAILQPFMKRAIPARPHLAKALDLGMPLRSQLMERTGILAAIDQLSGGVCVLD